MDGNPIDRGGGALAPQQTAHRKNPGVHGVCAPHHGHRLSAVHLHRPAGPGHAGPLSLRGHPAGGGHGAVHPGGGHVHDPHGRGGGRRPQQAQAAHPARFRLLPSGRTYHHGGARPPGAGQAGQRHPWHGAHPHRGGGRGPVPGSGHPPHPLGLPPPAAAAVFLRAGLSSGLPGPGELHPRLLRLRRRHHRAHHRPLYHVPGPGHRLHPER